MPKQSSGPKRGSLGTGKIARQSDTERFVEVAGRMRVTNTASRDVAVGKLKELGILTSDGRLSDKYK
jgi:hypothetical protein